MNYQLAYDAFAAQLALASIPSVWPNLDPEFEGEDTYLEAYLLPIQPERLTVGGVIRHRYSGLLQIAVVVPEGEGSRRALGIAQDLVELFPADFRFPMYPEMRIISAGQVATGLSDSPDYRLPVTLSFEILS